MTVHERTQTKIGFGPKVTAKAIVLGKPGDSVDAYRITREMAGKVLIVLSPVSPEFLEKVAFVGVQAVVTPSIHFRDYVRFAESGDLTLLVLLKFGNLEIPEELARKLSKLDGETVSVDGEEKTLSVV
jgi:hypothetical protein